MSKVLLVCQCPVDIEKVKRYFKARSNSLYAEDRARSNKLSGFYISPDESRVYAVSEYDINYSLKSYKRVYKFNTDLGSI